MKKMSKILAIILAVLMMCLCLGGCDEIDQMREEQAFWTDNDSADSIEYNGQIYKKIDVSTNVPDPLYNSTREKYISVTDMDVPVLLSNSFGDYLEVSDDENFIYGYVYHKNKTEYKGVYESSIESLYCKDDIYDAVVSKIKEGIEYTLYGYEYYTFDGEDDYVGKHHYYYLKDDEVKAVDKVINSVKPTEDDYVVYDYEYVLELDKVSDDKFFGKHTNELYYNAINGYYLGQYSESLGTYKYYKVPDKLTETFDNLASHEMKNRFEDGVITTIYN